MKKVYFGVYLHNSILWVLFCLSFFEYLEDRLLPIDGEQNSIRLINEKYF